jgi:CubicO group peptidase (beta-lactamase class C family)
VAPGWEGVREAFEWNFSTGAEVGAAYAVHHHGRPVVDLWAGVADQASGRPWTEGTVVPVYSTTKGFTAACANRLADDGRLDVDAPVAAYWPEFAENGKAEIPVSHVLSHQAGLAWIDGTMSEAEALSWDPVIEALARQAPHWPPGTQHGYHANTFGWLVGEIVRRITGMSVGRYLRKEIAEPLGLDLWVGLPESEEPRVAAFVPVVPPPDPGDPPRPSLGDMVRQMFGHDSPLAKSLEAPGGAFSEQEVWNSRRMHGAEVPSANGVTDARAVAKLYAASIGEVDGFRVFGHEQLRRATTRLTNGPDMVLLGMDIQFGLGYMLHSEFMRIGGERSFGHFGFGGSFGWGDPEAELAMGYVCNRLEVGLAGDARGITLIGATYGAIR